MFKNDTYHTRIVCMYLVYASHIEEKIKIQKFIFSITLIINGGQTINVNFNIGQLYIGELLNH